MCVVVAVAAVMVSVHLVSCLPDPLLYEVSFEQKNIPSTLSKLSSVSPSIHL